MTNTFTSPSAAASAGTRSHDQLLANHTAGRAVDLPSHSSSTKPTRPHVVRGGGRITYVPARRREEHAGVAHEPRRSPATSSQANAADPRSMSSPPPLSTGRRAGCSSSQVRTGRRQVAARFLELEASGVGVKSSSTLAVYTNDRHDEAVRRRS